MQLKSTGTADRIQLHLQTPNSHITNTVVPLNNELPNKNTVEPSTLFAKISTSCVLDFNLGRGFFYD